MVTTCTTMEHRRDEPPDDEFNLKEWALKSKMVSRVNTNSRRFSASNIIRSSFREDTRSFRSNITISSTASSPGYTLGDAIDPSTYSFTTALKALQARSAYSWECLSPDGHGFALNSKWNEAEKYICNPLSGEVPMECLSAKTLSGRSFRSLAGRVTMSAPLIYPSHSRAIHTKSSLGSHENEVTHFPIPEKKVSGMGTTTRDVGTQSTPPDSSSSPSPARTPPIEERSIKRGQAEVEDSPPSDMAKLEFEEKVEVKETEEKETKRKEEEEDDQKKKAKQKQKWKCSSRQSAGCFLSWRSLWMRKRQKEKHKPINRNIFITPH
ncbi:uncharacterized protein LOC114285869 isoform X1 [Camellia sinensis]|uniref:uncharacterized protein LOC114285869 isoform X1 n=1 Tax=Camellia sinensis TaxID=4442 RepID=UPI00103657EE|nr:uncharacterized protein LOC114285869 isoform X1 [Camellia sinensis]